MSDVLITPKEKKIFYDYWRTLPAVKSTPGEDYLKIHEQPIRGYILEILREGIEEIDPNTTLKIKRHVLTARELYIQVKKKLVSGTSCTLSNIYFHLSVLEEDPGYIKEVLTIKSGKQKIKYFGRTAKLFLYKDSNISKELAKTKNIIAELSIIINILQPSVTEEQVKSLFTKYSDKRIEAEFNSSDQVTKWIAQHETLLSEHNIDIRDLHDFLFPIFFDKSYNSQNIEEIVHLVSNN